MQIGLAQTSPILVVSCHAASVVNGKCFGNNHLNTVRPPLACICGQHKHILRLWANGSLFRLLYAQIAVRPIKSKPISASFR
ncbi:hypothetical protein DENSPDRAFT_314232 [Dentipellis sp. KUC8613]|nr:hypothetical protein DENSPDRAFT_314232 [Dentipellis sp. KUC8613]